MKDKLIALLTLLITLGRTRVDEEATITDLRQQLKLKQDEIKTLHGDDVLADPQVQALIDQAGQVAADSTPAPNHELDPAMTHADSPIEVPPASN